MLISDEGRLPSTSPALLFVSLLRVTCLALGLTLLIAVLKYATTSAVELEAEISLTSPLGAAASLPEDEEPPLAVSFEELPEELPPALPLEEPLLPVLFVSTVVMPFQPILFQDQRMICSKQSK